MVFILHYEKLAPLAPVSWLVAGCRALDRASCSNRPTMQWIHFGPEDHQHKRDTAISSIDAGDAQIASFTVVQCIISTA